METKRALTGTKTSQGFSLYYRNTKLTACCGVIGRVRESRNPKKVIRVALMESYGEIGRVPVNLLKTVVLFRCGGLFSEICSTHICRFVL